MARKRRIRVLFGTRIMVASCARVNGCEASLRCSSTVSGPQAADVLAGFLVGRRFFGCGLEPCRSLVLARLGLGLFDSRLLHSFPGTADPRHDAPGAALITSAFVIPADAGIQKNHRTGHRRSPV
jgi:hypothetical protein